MPITLAAVEAVLAAHSDPYLGGAASYALLARASDTQVTDDGRVFVHIVLPYPHRDPAGAFAAPLEAALHVAGARDVHIRWSHEIPRIKPQGEVAPLTLARNVIAVASGKGSMPIFTALACPPCSALASVNIPIPSMMLGLSRITPMA